VIPETSNAKMLLTPTVKQPRVNTRAAGDAGHNNIGMSINDQDTTNTANASQCQRLVKRHVVLFELSAIIRPPCQERSETMSLFAKLKTTVKHQSVLHGECHQYICSHWWASSAEKCPRENASNVRSIALFWRLTLQ
jgi:hypothetical protein